MSEQWFVKMAPLAEPALAAVADGRIKIVPERFEKIYNGWLENIKVSWRVSWGLRWGLGGLWAQGVGSRGSRVMVRWEKGGCDFESTLTAAACVLLLLCTAHERASHR